MKFSDFKMCFPIENTSLKGLKGVIYKNKRYKKHTHSQIALKYNKTMNNKVKKKHSI